ncbi:MAG TPA: hypothetical protein VM686_15340, partial [Polyangiaceae bacterium]|nr:hypothetical protein [Polyangiaceae bacterium]
YETRVAVGWGAVGRLVSFTGAAVRKGAARLENRGVSSRVAPDYCPLRIRPMGRSWTTRAML